MKNTLLFLFTSTAMNLFGQYFVLDNTFNCGFNAPVKCISVQADGKYLVGGEFTSTNLGQPLNSLAKINIDGSVDNSFNSGLGIAITRAS